MKEDQKNVLSFDTIILRKRSLYVFRIIYFIVSQYYTREVSGEQILLVTGEMISCAHTACLNRQCKPLNMTSGKQESRAKSIETLFNLRCYEVNKFVGESQDVQGSSGAITITQLRSAVA